MSKEKKKSTAKFILGSLIMAGVSIVVIPRIIEAVSSDVYKKMPRKTEIADDDDWGPEIVRKSKEEETV